MSKEELNSVQIELYDLPLTDDKDQYYGRINRTKSVGEEGLIKLAVQGRTDVNPATIRLCLSLVKEAAIGQILNGASVQFGLAHFNLSVNGVFVGNNPHWDPKLHHLKMNIAANHELHQAIKTTHPEVKGKAQDAMYITDVFDVKSETINKEITPGGLINITGKRIRIAGDKSNVGLYFVNTSNQEETKVEKSDMAHNKPSLITLLVPTDLPAGDYQLKVITQFSSASLLLKSTRTYLFNYILTVK